MRRYPLLLLPDGVEGAYTVRVPALPGLTREADALAEAVANARGAILPWIRSAEKHGEPIPEEALPAQTIIIDMAAKRLPAGSVQVAFLEAVHVPSSSGRNQSFSSALRLISAVSRRACETFVLTTMTRVAGALGWEGNGRPVRSWRGQPVERF